MKRFLVRLAAASLLLAGSAAHAQVVISQVYGGGGNSGAPLRSDFIELHNNGATAVVLDGWSVQYASAAGTSWQKTDLSGSIAPGGYYLVKQADGTNPAPALPTPDVVGTIPMSGSAGKVALVNHATALTGACPTGNIDFVGYGSSATCAEGAGPTAGLSATTAALRADNGCTDSNVNSADFNIGAPNPRNAAATAFACGGGGLPVLSISDGSADEGDSGTHWSGSLVASLDQPAGPGGVSFTAVTSNGTATDGSDYIGQNWGGVIPEGQTAIIFVAPVLGDTTPEHDETFFITLGNVTGAVLGDAQGIATIINDDRAVTAIHDIQGNGAVSPLANQFVFAEGIVTARKNNGFFLQASDGEADLDPATSEGVFVFTGAAPPASVAVGNRVRVGGTVVEFVPSADPGQAPLTEIGGSPSVELLSSGHAQPAPIVLTTTFPDPAGPIDQLERAEGMRVTVPSFTVAAPTKGNTSEPNATGSSNGIFHGVVSGVARPFREPGIQAPDQPPAGGSIPPIPRWDFNPELITVDSDALGAPALNLSTGAIITDLTGPLDFGFRRYTILRDPNVANNVTPGIEPRAARAPTADEFTVAAYNLERFFDVVNDPVTDDPVLTAIAYQNRLVKASLGIRQFLHTPDILGVVEVEKLSVLQDIASKVNADAVADGQSDPQYVAYLEEGNDIGGIDVGFLVKTAEAAAGIARVEVLSVTQQGKETTWIQPDGTDAKLNDRPPLLLDAVVHYADGRAFPIIVIVVHQRSLNGAEDDDANGDRVRRKRQAQAEYLATLIQQHQAAAPHKRIVTLGDFNAFAFNDGYVDAINVITGTPTPDEQTAVPGDGIDLVNPDLVNLGELASDAERYSFVFDGNAQTLDHVLINEELVVATGTASVDHARINADFPETRRNELSAARLSDHDPVVAYFAPRHRADLAVTVGATHATVRVGETIGYSATVTNLGPDTADYPAIGFALDAELPSLAVTAPSGWTCDAPQVTVGHTTVACNTATLAKDASASFTLSAAATPAQLGATVTLVAAADAHSLDPVTNNDQAQASVAVVASSDLAIDVSGPARLRSGTVGRFPVTVSNLGPDAAAQPHVQLRSDAPAANVALNPPQGWTCTLGNSSAGFAADCTRAEFAAAESQTFELRIVAPPRHAGGVTVQASVSAATSDLVDDNNTASYTAGIYGAPKR